MANGYKWGETNPVVSAAKDTALAVERGDLVWQDAGNANSPTAAADTVWNTNLATTQEDFHDSFLGVALSRGQVGETAPLRIATEGVFEFDCASATYAIGDLVGPAKQAGNALESQKVVAVATANLAIGRVVEGGASLTKVRVRIISTKVLGGPMTMA